MAQIKIYGLRSHLSLVQSQLSDTLHSCLVNSIGLPKDRRFHRFIKLDPEDFIFPDERSDKYTIIEISMFSGRQNETKRNLIKEIFSRFEKELSISPQDVEITIHESPKANWGIRGLPADELMLNYKVKT